MRNGVLALSNTWKRQGLSRKNCCMRTSECFGRLLLITEIGHKAFHSVNYHGCLHIVWLITCTRRAAQCTQWASRNNKHNYYSITDATLRISPQNVRKPFREVVQKRQTPTAHKCWYTVYIRGTTAYLQKKKFRSKAKLKKRVHKTGLLNYTQALLRM